MAAHKFTATMDKPAIEVAIKSIQSRGASLDKDIALTGLSVLAHIDKNKEVSLFIKLYNSLPKGSRTNALVAWGLAFGKIAVNMDKLTKKERPFIYDGEKITNLAGATEKPWFDFKKPKDPAEEFDFQAEVAAFQLKVQAWIKAGKVSPTDHLAIGVLSAKIVDDVPAVANDAQGTAELVVVA